MQVVLNKDPEHVKAVRYALKGTGGYCPCAIVKSEESLCICKDFRDKIDDHEFEGYCHCELYYKSKE